METSAMAKQMIDFQKTIFENSYTALNTVLDQTEQMSTNFLNQMPWVTEDGKKAVQESVKFYKKARENFKKAVDEGFLRMEEAFAGK